MRGFNQGVQKVDVFITDVASFLPGEPVENDRMEEILGMINLVPSRTRKIILRNNGIKQRHYAIDPETGELTHTNSELTAEAVRRLRPYEGFEPDHIECLCCGTSSPDQIMPGHGLMVHGELGIGPCEVMTSSGICLSGITALKYAYMNVALGLTQNAVATGSELASSFIRAAFCNLPSRESVSALENRHELAFEADFLRWMLSDGAGAVYLTNSPPRNRLSFRVEWIDILSHAGSLETCMYAGAVKDENGKLRGWRHFSSLDDAVREKAFLIKQDARLLNEEIIRTAVDRSLLPIVEKHGLEPEDIDWFLPHYSSEYFRPRLCEQMERMGFGIPEEKWFTNLTYKGNTGAAAIFIILDEFFRSKRMKKGNRILCFIPESGRFSIGYMMLTVV